MGITADKIVFRDDRREMVEAASSRGWRGMHVAHDATAADELDELEFTSSNQDVPNGELTGRSSLRSFRTPGFVIVAQVR